MYSRGEYYPPEYYRRRGLAAKQRAAQSTDRRLKDAIQRRCATLVGACRTSCVARETAENGSRSDYKNQ